MTDQHLSSDLASLSDILRQHGPSVRLNPLSQKAIPRLAKDPKAVRAIANAVRKIPTTHSLRQGDSRDFENVGPVQLIVTSPPYFDLKKYPDHESQLGGIHDYQIFLKELGRVWEQCLRVLVPGGRLIVIVGDVCRSRRQHGEHQVIPLHGSIAHQCYELGFSPLATFAWHKISNAAFEVQNGSAFLGKPYEPNAVVKNDLEFILMLRKPGGYRQPTEAMRVLSLIGEKQHRAWFNQIFTIRGASTRAHPAPYPVDLVEPLIRMFSFVGDTVLDPFSGTATTSLAAARAGRNSIGIELEPTYHAYAVERLRTEFQAQKLEATLTRN